MTEQTNTARGARFRQIREAAGETQPQFAERLTHAAAALGIDRAYTFVDVSTRETGRRALDIEDFILATHVDPEHRTVLWLAFGRELPWSALNARLMPRPARVAETPPEPAGAKQAGRKPGQGKG